MKKTLATACTILAALFANAQQKEGRVIFERTVQMQIAFAGLNEEMARMIPRSRTDKFELTFGNNQSLWRAAEQGNEDEANFTSAEGGGMQIRMVAAGSNDVSYNNFETDKRVEQREVFDKKFIIDDSIQPFKWKMAGETKNILGHNCMKATTTQITQRMMTNMDDGKMERKLVSDTSLVVAWFATDIPVSAGPGEYQGQLPGLILEMDISNGRQVFKAVELSPKGNMAIIKEPAGKKRYTQDEFRKERDKMMAEMERNNMNGGGGGRRVIRMN